MYMYNTCIPSISSSGINSREAVNERNSLPNIYIYTLWYIHVLMNFLTLVPGRVLHLSDPDGYGDLVDPGRVLSPTDVESAVGLDWHGDEQGTLHTAVDSLNTGQSSSFVSLNSSQ